MKLVNKLSLMPVLAFTGFTSLSAVAADLGVENSAPTKVATTSAIPRRVCQDSIDSACYIPTAFSKVDLRTSGLWSEDKNLPIRMDELSGEALDVLSQYQNFSINTLAVDAKARFVAKVSFSYDSEEQVTYLTGYISTVNAKTMAIFQGSIEANIKQRAYREAVKDAEANWKPSMNNQLAANRVRTEDARRNMAVMEAINAWLGSRPPASSAVAVAEDIR